MFDRYSRRALNAAAAAVALLAASSGQAWSETLADAIALAYQSNPALQAQRADQRALDETYVQARSGLRPTFDVSGTVSYDDPNSFFSNDNFGVNTSVGMSQPLFTGGRAASAINAADSDVRQGREALRSVESQVIAGVIQAFVDVRRDVEALRIRQENVQVLRRQLEEATARFEVGEITRTDVAQAEARLALSQAQLSAAEAQLSVSRAGYGAVVGQAPGALEPEPPLAGLPGTFEEALAVAEENNPSLRAAKFAQSAAESRVSQARAAFRPSLSLRASYGASDSFDADDTSVYDDYRDLDSVSASATVSIPIFTGGLNGSRVRQALERRNAAALDVEAARRDTLQRVSSSWAQLLSARSALAANNEQVRAARIAAEGVRQEAQVGLRTTLDVLNAETELREAELALNRARRDEYVAGSQLLAAMGKLEAANLVEGVETYDPEKNFNRVRLRGWTPLDPALRVVDGVAAPGSGGRAR